MGMQNLAQRKTELMEALCMSVYKRVSSKRQNFHSPNPSHSDRGEANENEGRCLAHWPLFTSTLESVCVYVKEKSSLSQICCSYTPSLPAEHR